MSDLLIEQQGLSLEDFQRQFIDEPFELFQGEIKPMSPNMLGHSEVSNRILMIFFDYFQKHPVGKAYHETTFILPDDERTNWVKGSRIPDVMFIRSSRIESYKQQNPDWATQPLALVPDITMEVVSINDKLEEVQRKAVQYLKDGIQEIWIFLPQNQQILQYQQGSNQITVLNLDDFIQCETVLPNFSVRVKTFFSD